MNRHTYAAITLLATTILGTACAMTGDEEVGSTGQSVKSRPTASSTGTTTARPTSTPSGTTTAPPATTALGTADRCCCSEDNSFYTCGDKDGGAKYGSLSCIWTLQAHNCGENSYESSDYNTKKKCENATSLRCQSKCPDENDTQLCKDKWGDHTD